MVDSSAFRVRSDRSSHSVDGTDGGPTDPRLTAIGAGLNLSRDATASMCAQMSYRCRREEGRNEVWTNHCHRGHRAGRGWLQCHSRQERAADNWVDAHISRGHDDHSVLESADSDSASYDGSAHDDPPDNGSSANSGSGCGSELHTVNQRRQLLPTRRILPERRSWRQRD